MALTGWGCGKVTLGVILVVGLVWLSLLPLAPLQHLRRWTHDDFHLRPLPADHSHPFMKNYWYRYVHDTVTAKNVTNCYVCSVMPTHSEGPTVYGKPMNMSQAKCAASFAGIGYQSIVSLIFSVDGDYVNITTNGSGNITVKTVVQDATGIYPDDPGFQNGTCLQDFWVDFNVTKTNVSFPFSVLIYQDPTTYNHSVCYKQNNGTRWIGGNTTNCHTTFVSSMYGSPVSFLGPSNGTYWVDGVAWLCGPRAYFVLPPNWFGVCAPIFVSDHTFLIAQGSKVSIRSRRKRSISIQPHDSLWGTDVPPEHKLWGTGSKVALSLFPWAGVGKLMLRVETLNYRLGLFINSSILIDQQQNEQLDITRQMVIQNRMALDLLTAAQGGVCVLLNQTCCTYIPDNVHSPNMTIALDRLRDLQKVMTMDSQPQSSWLDWFVTGTWWSILMKMCLPFVLFFILFFCCFITVIPCLKMFINQALNAAFRTHSTMFLSLTQNMETEPVSSDSDEEDM
ncbi:endogenous retrovirus group FC1 Env polyprotein-like [Brienomyrus brachyistius]|uniref:endogenous retrovirus group FC1 Env polyprotein-like n=1 Tax=Brienomyrus brachyistius TaxID=42636 RepID=UPI0020B2A6F0|nr:endogenous retrovirus group FC1 Env polyprotein-like [Brienomyrus brachyistius]